MLLVGHLQSPAGWGWGEEPGVLIEAVRGAPEGAEAGETFLPPSPQASLRARPGRRRKRGPGRGQRQEAGGPGWLGPDSHRLPASGAGRAAAAPPRCGGRPRRQRRLRSLLWRRRRWNTWRGGGGASGSALPSAAGKVSAGWGDLLGSVPEPAGENGLCQQLLRPVPGSAGWAPPPPPAARPPLGGKEAVRRPGLRRWCPLGLGGGWRRGRTCPGVKFPRHKMASAPPFCLVFPLPPCGYLAMIIAFIRFCLPSSRTSSLALCPLEAGRMGRETAASPQRFRLRAEVRAVWLPCVAAAALVLPEGSGPAALEAG